ncbi:TIGR02206 family membrane protein [Leptospira hartskeerlii]|uniref:TIGR02206 family membrane protein n=1 Tax=Leptospira hartskeerlii TaxID=2023177 RepID=A0A2M9XDA1_9LEPT|nr:TIGR02206 family membrane protein [Leptospira hartskeerlii]PJZ25677.1 TIGR02206 family membrane protein [Leptospira hartskeerlii]PJZ35500.1 TIGR02206 family membrane protein [Leptospira hartskeerlii]
MKWVHWSFLHISILIFSIMICALAIWMGKRIRNSKIAPVIGYFLGGLLLLNGVVYIIYRIQKGYWEIRFDLPMEFCDWAMFVTVAALFTRNRLMSELSYFWVLSGSIHALLTPNLAQTFPHLSFFLFFIGHLGLVVSSLYIVFGLGLFPRQGSILRTIVYSEIYFVSALTLDFLIDANYGYLRFKPSGGSILNFLGDWPIYLLSIQILGILAIVALYLPFKRSPNQT